MWPFRRKTKDDNDGKWSLGSLKTANGDLAGTHLMLVGAERHQTAYPYVVFVTLKYEGGPLPTIEQMQQFDEFDNKLSSLLESCSGLYVGVFMHNGIRDWICYVQDGQAAANRIYRELSSYSPQIEVKHDPTWNEYRSFASMRNG